ncbi:MAG: hypothetical protein ACE5F1_15505, partial [Planctomycetota bacterium]
TPRTCVGCHLQSYNNATNPNHKLAGFPTTCETCHTTLAWKPANFDHSRFFTLTGKHKTARCNQCHVNGIFKGTPRTCVGCHLQSYNNATNPNHKLAGFPTTCDTCHTTLAWKPSTFDHSRFFPLIGKHLNTKCSACHVNGKFKGTPRTCVGCHLSDYNKTTNPPHLSLAYPTTCESCHRPTGWSPANFNHRFIITKGPHRRACAECHRVPSNFKIASCTHCHEHNKTKMDQKHRNKKGYVYSSPACISCHPEGKE